MILRQKVQRLLYLLENEMVQNPRAVRNLARQVSASALAHLDEDEVVDDLDLAEAWFLIFRGAAAAAALAEEGNDWQECEHLYTRALDALNAGTRAVDALGWRE